MQIIAMPLVWQEWKNNCIVYEAILMSQTWKSKGRVLLNLFSWQLPFPWCQQT